MTIKEIAKMAGVSSSAVSRYFNGGSLSDEKRKAIAKVVEKYSYTPNVLASGMRTKKSGQIGVIVPHIHSDSVSQMMAGIAEGLNANQYSFILGSTDEDRDKEVSYIESMQNAGMDGIILMGTAMTPRLRTAIENSKIPIVVTGQSFSGFSCVYHDDVRSMRDITLLMLKKRKKVAYIGVNEEDEATGRARKKGVMKAFKKMGYDPNKVLCGLSDFTIEGGYREAKKLLEKCPDLDGIVCATDRIAHGAIIALKESGRKVPSDVSVTGVGDCWADRVSEPQLTTVKLYFGDCGRIAVDQLMTLIKAEGGKVSISDIKLGYEIVERGSI